MRHDCMALMALGLALGNLAQADQSVLTTLVSQDPVYVYFDADEHSFLRYQKAGLAGLSGQGRAVRVALVGDSGFSHSGTLDFSDNQLQPGTGTMRLRARLANPDRVLTPGLFARVQMQSGPQRQGAEPQALLIDDKAVLTDQDRKYVYVVDKDGKAQRRDIQLGRTADGRRVFGKVAGDDAGTLDQLLSLEVSPVGNPGTVTVGDDGVQVWRA